MRAVIRIPGLLRSYTAGAATVSLDDLPAAATLRDALARLDARFPGIAFRVVDEQTSIRAHIKIFVDAALARDLDATLAAGAEIVIVGALSGG
jgi:molybdopterin synthase sulfur carrier subunit